jgi:ATP-dependent DNA helicase PIF1
MEDVYVKNFSFLHTSNKQIVLTVATSRIASLLLLGGRITHSKFMIPIPPLESATCGIDKGSDRAELIKLAKLIIWDEAPMAHKLCFEALDRTLKDLMMGMQIMTFHQIC